jgi:hypothetical protein
MDEMKLGQRTHRSAPVTMILMHMVRKGEKIKSGLVQVWVFRAKPATDSDRKRPLIPIDSGHPFRRKAATPS